MSASPLRRLRRSLTTLPDARGWVLCGLAAVVAGGLMAAIGFSTGLYALTQTAPGLPLRLLTVLFVPALGEEIPFRGLFVPSRDENRRPWIAIAVSTALYVS
ncbi:CPBP family glutamic-type intramembrane protease, partial [Caulobacter sp.]|uniref:CPBP family glutamic-type intramembrane protease n=1 Tax=Caulobacter sp. TaxID=78 RepID=UPI003443259D